MFNAIALRYDFLNHLLSFGIDRYWRKSLVKHIAAKNVDNVLDVATGTADLAIMLAHQNQNTKIVGVDIATGMLEIGQCKLQEQHLNDRVSLQRANAMDMPFADGSFGVTMVAFGVRNFQDIGRGIEEIFRVMKDGGTFYALEFSLPSNVVVQGMYKFYFRRILPVIGSMVSKNKEAYTYLPNSILQFPQGDDFLRILRNVGFSGCAQKRLTFGVATLYMGVK